MGKSKNKSGTRSCKFQDLQGKVDGFGEDILTIESKHMHLPFAVTNASKSQTGVVGALGTHESWIFPMQSVIPHTQHLP